jgi:hypothetical protein
VERERPDVVFLFSGYLYTVNNLFHVETVEGLVRRLAARGCRLVTSDPFHGLLAEVDDTTFSVANPRKAWFTWLFRRLAELFRDVVHLDYIDAGAPGRRTVSFHNPRVVRAMLDAGALRARLAGALGVDRDTPRWLFVLATEDYIAHVRRHGRERFEAIVLAKLAETCAAGRQPVLVAPRACLEGLGDRLRALPSAVAVPATPVDVFMTLVGEAEHVFYWNIFSNTTSLRVLARRPFFAFDAGHMVRAMPSLLDVAGRRHGLGTPVFLDEEEPLDADRLAALAPVQEEAMRGPRERFERAPSPEAMVASLLEEPARP